jgi:PAS domain S-box-containing protein
MASRSFSDHLASVDSLLLGQLGRLEQITTRLETDLDLPSKLDEIASAIGELLGSDMSSIAIFEDIGSGAIVGSTSDLSRELVKHISQMAIETTDQQSGNAAQAHEPVIIEDTRTDSRCTSCRALIEQADIRSIWLVPVSSSRGKLLGTFASYHRKPHRPTPREVALAYAYGRHAAVSIENWRSYKAAIDGEKRYRLLMENASDGIALFDRDGYCEIGNTAVHKMLGYTRGEIVNRNVRDIIHPQDLAGDPVPYLRLDAGETTLKERRLVCKDGSLLPVEVTSRRVAENTYLAIVRDISTRRSMERARLAIYKLASALVRTTTIEEIYDQSMSTLEAAIGVKRASISLVDESGAIRFTAVRGVSEYYVRRVEASPWLPNNSELIVVGDVSSSPLTKGYAEVLARESIGAVGAVPLTYGSSLLGRLVLYFDNPHEFTDEERHVAETIASHVALAIARKRSEEAIATSERDYRGLFEQAHDAIVILDPENGTVLDVNQRACDLYNIPQSEFTGRALTPSGEAFSFSADIRPSLTSTELSEMKRLAESEAGPGVPYETRHLTDDGRELFLEVNVSSVSYKGRRAILSISRDVSERKRAEAALLESEQRFSRAFGLSPNPMAIASLEDCRYIAVNERLVELLGYSREELIGRTADELNSWGDPAARKQAFDLFKADGSVRDFETNYRTKSGRIRRALISIEVIEVGGEKCLLLSGHDITERKRAENQLAASEERFSKAFKANPNPMWIFTYKEGQCIDANDSALKMIGYSREEVVGRTSREIDAWAQIREPLKKALGVRKGGSQSKVEVKLHNKDGQELSVLLAAEIIELREKRCLLISGTDITDRKRAERERDGLLASERLARSRAEHAWGLTNQLLAREHSARTEVEFAHHELQTILDTMADRVMVVGKDDRLIRANRSFYDQLGLRPEQCEGRQIVDLMHPPESPYSAQSCPLCELRNKGKRGAIEVPPGVVSDYPFFASVDPIVDGSDQTVAFIQVIRDLSDLYQARADADRERISLEATIEQMADGLIVFDRAARVVRANRHAEALFGFTRSEMAEDLDFGLREDRFFNEAGQKVPVDQLPVNRALRSQRTVECRGWYHRPNGDRLLMSVTVSPLFDAHDKMVGAIGLFRDVTQHQRQYERDLQADKLRALGQLASGVAHNLNNSLAAVLGYTQLSIPKIDKPEVEKYLRVVEKSAKDAARMVERIQNFARARANKYEFISLRILDVVRDAIEITKPRWRNDAESRSIKYEVSLNASLESDVLIEGEPSELREVFVNIVLNALDAMPSGGRLDINAVADDKEISLSFVDSGAGMTDEIKQRIFEPFFSTKGVAGLGMGLSESYRIVERHGGRIDVESNLASGTTFHIALPLVFKSETNGRNQLPQPSIANKSVLVIDDEDFVRNLLSTMFAGWGHTVLTAASADEGLSLLAAHEIDVVFLDLAMPITNGISAAANIKAKWPDTRVVLMTGYGADKARELAAVENRVDFALSKPFTMPDLQNALLAVLNDKKKPARN